MTCVRVTSSQSCLAVGQSLPRAPGAWRRRQNDQEKQKTPMKGETTGSDRQPKSRLRRCKLRHAVRQLWRGPGVTARSRCGAVRCTPATPVGMQTVVRSNASPTQGNHRPVVRYSMLQQLAAAPLHFAGPAPRCAAGALQHAAAARPPLVDPVAPAALRPRAPALRPGTRLAAQGPGRGAARGAANRLDAKAAGEGGEDQDSRRGRGCGAGVWR
eukprot:COSAG04_NODE_209_length_20232_cov_116.817315_16_plen_214_part_00